MATLHAQLGVPAHPRQQISQHCKQFPARTNLRRLSPECVGKLMKIVIDHGKLRHLRSCSRPSSSPPVQELKGVTATWTGTSASEAATSAGDAASDVS